MNEKKGFGTAAILSGLLISGAGLLYKKFKERSKEKSKKRKEENLEKSKNSDDLYKDKVVNSPKNINNSVQEYINFKRNEKVEESYVSLKDNEIYFRGRGTGWKATNGIGYTEAAKIISGVSKCEAALNMKITYRFEYKKYEEQEKHDEEIELMKESCRREWDDIFIEITDDWNEEKGEEWRPIPGVAIYGKPDLKIIRKGGKVIIGDAKTGKQHNWHKIQNKLALFALTNSSRDKKNSNFKNDFDHHEPYATVLKYSNKEMEIEYIKNSEEIISKVDLEILRSKLKAALYSSQPKYIPNVECKFCQGLKGCKKGQEYLKLNQ